MKKLLLLTLLGISVLSFNSNAQTKTRAVTKKASHTSKKDIKMINIPVDTAVKMVARNFKEKMVADRYGKMKKDTRSVYFDLASLKTWLGNIEKEGGQGIRIYFAAYDNGHIVRSSSKAQKDFDYSNSSTLVLVSTKDTVGIDEDTNKKIIIHKDYYSTNKAVKTYGYFLGNFADPQNKGELCPPPTKCCTIGASLLCTPPPSSN